MDDLIKHNNIPNDDQRPKPLPALMNILLFCVKTLLCLPVSVLFLPFYLLGLMIWGHPPLLPVWSRYGRFMIAAFTEGKPKDNIPFTNRITVFVVVLNLMVKMPINAMCWYLDELLFSGYHKVDIQEPIFFVTAPRSGSTQLTHYLEDDKENFITPTVVEALLPYIWYWKLVNPVVTKLLGKKGIDLSSYFGTEANKRHHLDLSKTDSWNTLAEAWHLNFFSAFLGSSFMSWAYSYAKLDDQPIDQKFLSSFLALTHPMMKKCVYMRGKPNQRVLLKGRFLEVAEALKQQYPKAKFFTTVRPPLEQMQSFINFTRVLSADGPYRTMLGLFPPSWRIIRDYVVHTQIPYCKQEMAFYKEDEENRLVIPFAVYVKNLSATLQHIYAFCNIPIPDHVVTEAIKIQNTTHDRTKRRASYDPNLNRSLENLGVDEEKVKEHLADYIEWIGQQDKKFE